MICSLGTTVVKPAWQTEKAEPSWQAMTVGGPTAHGQLIAEFQCTSTGMTGLDRPLSKWSVATRSGYRSSPVRYMFMKHRLKMQFKWKRRRLNFFGLTESKHSRKPDLYMWQAYIVPPAAIRIRKPCPLPTEYICVSYDSHNKENYVHRWTGFYHDTNCGLSGVWNEFLYLINTSVKIW